jgi:hypothetical protein
LTECVVEQLFGVQPLWDVVTRLNRVRVSSRLLDSPGPRTDPGDPGLSGLASRLWSAVWRPTSVRARPVERLGPGALTQDAHPRPVTTRRDPHLRHPPPPIIASVWRPRRRQRREAMDIYNEPGKDRAIEFPVFLSATVGRDVRLVGTK